jgi:CheY-like chemotaxis protein
MNGRRRILVVDDDPAVQTMVRSFLEREGYEVTMARDGREAILLIAGTDFDVVLLDVLGDPLDLPGMLEAARDGKWH